MKLFAETTKQDLIMNNYVVRARHPDRRNKPISLHARAVTFPKQPPLCNPIQNFLVNQGLSSQLQAWLVLQRISQLSPRKLSKMGKSPPKRRLQRSQRLRKLLAKPPQLRRSDVHTNICKPCNTWLGFGKLEPLCVYMNNSP